MSLASLVDNSKTDKNTTHAYLGLYERLLNSKKLTATNILEVGIGDVPNQLDGGSIKLWHDYFTNATIHAIDILPITKVSEHIKNNDRIKLYTSINAYDSSFVDSFISNNIKFDMVLDDGPHSLESIKDFVRLYSKLLKDDGILIIEHQKKTNLSDLKFFKETKNYGNISFSFFSKENL